MDPVFKALSDQARRELLDELWETEPIGDSCRLTVTHGQLAEDADPHLYGDWTHVVMTGCQHPPRRTTRAHPRGSTR